MKKLSEDHFESEWPEFEPIRDPERLARLKEEVMAEIMKSLDDPRPNITSKEMKVHIEDIMRRARQR